MTVFGEIAAGLSILERVAKAWKRIRHGASPPEETLATRFIRLFESHGVHRNQIPRFFGHGLGVQDMKDDAALHARLDDGILDDARELFAVHREWLDGAEEEIYPCHDFYKQPDEFVAFVTALKAGKPERDLYGVLIAPTERHRDAGALFLLHERIGNVGEKEIYRHHLCPFGSFTYWNARAYLTACIAIAAKNKVHIRGICRPWKGIEPYIEGKKLLDPNDGLIKGKRWDPEFMALEPKDYLEGIDLERDGFGIRAT